MRINTNDLTLKRNYLNKYRFLIKEYEQVKSGEHPTFVWSRTFIVPMILMQEAFKILQPFKQSDNELDLLPGKRGPRYSTRKPSLQDEQQVLELRQRGCNKFEIASQLKRKSDKFTPSASGYIIF